MWKKKKNKEDDLRESFEDRYFLVKDLYDERGKTIHVLEKEVAYWKEKALNFKKFHL